MFKPLFYLIATILSLPLISATASSQFHLNPLSQVSDCFYTCHQEITSTTLIGGTNNVYWVARNCQNQEWQALLPLCLVQTCISAPDTAYALEYATSFCERAGVDISNVTLPESYLEAAAEYFQSEGYLSGARKSVVWGSGVIGVLALVAGSVVGVF